MKKAGVVIFLAIALLAAAAVSYCQGSPEKDEIKTATGNICVLDWVASTIIIKCTDTNLGDEITIFVPNNTKVYRGTELIMFVDIHVGDRVKVDYYNASPGPLKAVSITDMSLAEAMN